MKIKITALSLLALTILILFFSMGLVVTSSNKTVWGPYAIQEIERTAGEKPKYKEVKLNAIGITVFFGSLCIPVFIAGYLWGKNSGNRNSNKSSDPT